MDAEGVLDDGNSTSFTQKRDNNKEVLGDAASLLLFVMYPQPQQQAFLKNVRDISFCFLFFCCFFSIKKH